MRRPVIAAADDLFAVVAERHAADLTRVSLEREDDLTRVRVPHLQLGGLFRGAWIRTGADDAFASHVGEIEQVIKLLLRSQNWRLLIRQEKGFARFSVGLLCGDRDKLFLGIAQGCQPSAENANSWSRHTTRISDTIPIPPSRARSQSQTGIQPTSDCTCQHTHSRCLHGHIVEW